MNTVLNAAIDLFRIPLAAPTRRWARCALCQAPLQASAFGGGAVRGLYCCVDHAERAGHRAALRVVPPYAPRAASVEARI